MFGAELIPVAGARMSVRRRAANVLCSDGHCETKTAAELAIDPADASTNNNKRQWDPKVR